MRINLYRIPIAVAVIALITAFLCHLSRHARAQGTASASPNLALGNPDNATSDPSNHSHFLIVRPQFAESYNDTLRIPNWVEWHLSAKDIGSEERGIFRPDTGLPVGFVRVTTGDYTGAGCDRGHLCPSKDRSASRVDNDAVFTMANICPQLHTLNGGPWERLESYCRTLAQSGDDLYILAGNVVPPDHKSIGRNRVAVPSECWKIVLIVPPGGKIGASDRVIVVDMPNNDTVALTTDWHRYASSVARIAQETGLHFGPLLAGK